MRRSLAALALALLSFAGAAHAQIPAAFVRAGQRDVATLAHQAPTPTRDAQIAARIDASHELSIRSIEPTTDGHTRVKTIVTRTSEPSETHDVDYILAEPRPGTFAIVDIVTDGASLTTGYRSQLTKMLQTPGQGYAYLVQSLQSRVTPTSATSLPSKPRPTVP